MPPHNIIPLYRGIRLAAARPREGVPTPPPPPARIASEIEQRLRDDAPVHIEIRGEPSFIDRIADWLGDRFDSPRGFAFFAGLLFPLTVAAFCIGYFGLRELLAVLS